MINKFTLALIFSISFFSVKAQQVPQALNYQAVARTATGLIIPAQNINVRFSVLDAAVNGTVVYRETHAATTNNFGLFTLSIGKGTAVTGTFAGINWSSADKFLQVEISSDASNNYQLQGTSQLLSVPYALYAEKTKLLAGNNTINITNGNTISGNYQAANNTVLLTGNAIAGNYQAANNTILLSGNTIAGNYQPGVGINLTGNTISHNMVAGTGINITGNTITNTGTNLWTPDATGINYQAGSVGIGNPSVQGSRLTIQQVPTGGFSAAMDIFSSDTYHTVYRFRNTTVNQEWQFMVGGSTNPYQRPGTLGIFNTRNLRWPFYIDPSNEFIGIGSNSAVMPAPKSRLHVFSGDINIEQIGSGIIMKSPNGNCWRVTIDDAGNLVRTAITCL